MGKRTHNKQFWCQIIFKNPAFPLRIYEERDKGKKKGINNMENQLRNLSSFEDYNHPNSVLRCFGPRSLLSGNAWRSYEIPALQTISHCLNFVSVLVDSVDMYLRVINDLSQRLNQLKNAVLPHFYKVFQVFGIAKRSQMLEEAWPNPNTDVEMSKPKINKWQYLIVLSILAPLLFKLFESKKGFSSSVGNWNPKKERGMIAAVLFPFQSENSDELSVAAKAVLMIAPSKYQIRWQEGWAYVCNKKLECGFVPIAHIGPMPPPVRQA